MGAHMERGLQWGRQVDLADGHAAVCRGIEGKGARPSGVLTPVATGEGGQDRDGRRPWVSGKAGPRRAAATGGRGGMGRRDLTPGPLGSSLPTPLSPRGEGESGARRGP